MIAHAHAVATDDGMPEPPLDAAPAPPAGARLARLIGAVRAAVEEHRRLGVRLQRAGHRRWSGECFRLADGLDDAVREVAP
jgi:hypothetical protein